MLTVNGIGLRHRLYVDLHIGDPDHYQKKFLLRCGWRLEDFFKSRPPTLPPLHHTGKE